jgi:hypothetical protein
LQNADGSFATAPAVQTDEWNPRQMFIADFNGDGHPDLAVVNRGTHGCTPCGPDTSGNLEIFTGDGTGTFTPETSYTFGSFTGPVTLTQVDGTFRPGEPYSIAGADLNGDGKVDLLVGTDRDGTVQVMHGNGDGTFSHVDGADSYANVMNDYSGTSDVGEVAVADMNRDCKADVVIGDSVGVNVLHGNGDGTFEQHSDTYQLPEGAGPGPHSAPTMAVTDLNGDGAPDVVIGGTSRTWVQMNSTPLPGSTTGIASSLDPSVNGDSVTFTAAITSDAQCAATGTVSFFDGGTELGTSPVSNGEATLDTSGLAVGDHAIIAEYSGDANHAASTSAVPSEQSPGILVQTVNAPPGGMSVPQPPPAPPRVARRSASAGNSAVCSRVSPAARSRHPDDHQRRDLDDLAITAGGRAGVALRVRDVPVRRGRVAAARGHDREQGMLDRVHRRTVRFCDAREWSVMTAAWAGVTDPRLTSR